MHSNSPNGRRESRLHWLAAAAAMAAVMAAAPAEARVTRIVIDDVAPLTGQAIPYEQIRGRAFGELDPNDPHNSVITDIKLGADTAGGKVRYETSFNLVKPVDMNRVSGFMWHDVPNRGGAGTIVVEERELGDIGLRSGWQADNAGNTGVPANRAAGTNHWVAAPIAKVNGVPVAGEVFARIVNQGGASSKPLMVQANPVPYLPATLDTTKATLKTHLRETVDGVVTEGPAIAAGDWAFAKCDAGNPFPGTPIDIDPANAPGNLPVHICLRNGFDANLLYQVVYPAQNAYVLGVGMAAFRDVGTFFRYEAADDFGTRNPVSGLVKGTAVRGVSQSGNMVRQFIFMGLNQDERNRKVYDGAWPIIAGRRVAANSRWAQPDGVLELYQQGSEGPQWWTDWPDPVRKQPTGSIFSRCSTNDTCPKVIEHFGSAEVYALKLTPEWIGTAGDADIPLPRNVRRYYVPGSHHGGGAGGFTHMPATTTGASCPGNSYGTGTLPANPVPHTEITNVLRLAMRDWVLNGTPPPPSRWPTLAGKTLVEANKKAMGFPSGVPGIPDSIFLPENFAFPVFDYDWGPQFNHSEASGVPTGVPPRIGKAIAMKVPKVDADGNEIDGVPTVLVMAPLGTYLGFNITAAGFHKGQVCNYVGGYVPFARTRAERLASGDPRLSLEERYGSHEGYQAAVRAAAEKASAEGFLLPADRDRLIRQAAESSVLR
ncbi:alpha/beta hydrolase domain-containing protein [Variovorax paradoxus]|uniref:alpha/beta hydrolase domain-containing protein n=1 Tax=Variovorax paradoxus TaxID=34073 RepID=UPI0024805E87|nr:alpha/beta hydrolase domain-containing protein [Variovorax paradoxus]WGT62832.1 alpha/beta hydrolase domain-containing protein [Variovorax paradoxus]